MPNSTYEPVTLVSPTLPPNSTYSHVNMTATYPTLTSTVTEYDSPPTPSTTPLKTTEQPVIDMLPDLVARSTSQLSPEKDSAHDCDYIVDPATLTPGPPGAPPPCTSRTPAPPPSETQTENGPPDAKGITWCSDGYRVTVDGLQPAPLQITLTPYTAPSVITVALHIKLDRATTTTHTRNYVP